ncbi:hypothetical protein CALVIDRAFT_547838 [Calocera viscosa TUFC12733]|uniref:Transcription factor BYE1 n=1 Tax=Calocera viscosa (strain TUFC12733) TaxID=1330018 RepID=A0A167RZV5_CALVF|nr:hypothetical protein CALVIDRAFT_547838 [Calocera viscosa TUFC12733]
MPSRGQKRKRSECICGGVYLATQPEVLCETCRKWFHFACIGLTEINAEDMTLYICARCSSKAHRTTHMFWDIPPNDTTFDFLLKAESQTTSEADQDDRRKARSQRSITKYPNDYDEESEESISSDDNYSDDTEKEKGVGHSPTRRDLGRWWNKAQQSTSHKPVRRSAGMAEEAQRKWGPHSVEAGSQGDVLRAISDDPVRKFCYGRLLEVILPMFQEQFDHQSVTLHDVPVPEKSSHPDNQGSEETPFKSPQKAATAFVDELEQHLYDTFAEFDEKKGKTIAAAKYRERFRTLNFNLSQNDRALLRRRIGSWELSAEDLAKMSSGDLANEERQHEIEIARRESLQHSILEAPAAPTAKITHKGEEIIEAFSAYEARRQGESTEEERALSPQPHLRSQSVDFLSSKEAGTVGQGYSTMDSLNATQSLPSQVERENPSSQSTGLPLAALPANKGSTISRIIVPPDDLERPEGVERSPKTRLDRTSFSPLTPSHPNFSLSTLWSMNVARGDRQASPTDHLDTVRDGNAVSLHDEFLDSLEDGNLEELLAPEEQDHGPSRDENVLLSVGGRPEQFIVWRGELLMPMEPAPPLSCYVVAHQIGGPKLDEDPATWNLLFTSTTIRIDGRVPVPSSTEYLLNMRMSASKELVAISLSPQSAPDEIGFRQLFELLYSRGRHGIVFPWGTKPSETAIGKDLYLVPLKSNDPLPEYVQLLNHLELPVHRLDDVLLGVFVLYRARVPRARHLSLDRSPAGLSVNTPALLPSWPSQPHFGPTSDELLPNTLSTSMAGVTQDIARLTPEQLRLVQSLIEQAGLAAPGSGPTLPTAPTSDAIRAAYPQPMAPTVPSVPLTQPVNVQALLPAPGAHNTGDAYSAARTDWRHVTVSQSHTTGTMGERLHDSSLPTTPEQQRLERRDSKRSRTFDRPRDSGWGTRRGR